MQECWRIESSQSYWYDYRPPSRRLEANIARLQLVADTVLTSGRSHSTAGKVECVTLAGQWADDDKHLTLICILFNKSHRCPQRQMF